MKARELIDKASFGPTTLRAIYQAFDDAWSEIAADYSNEEASEARTRLAKALLSVENAGNTDAGTLKRLALELMATQERSEIAPS